MQQKPMFGTARQKRNRWSGKRVRAELHFSIKTQKHQFQRTLRNGKPCEMPRKSNHYRKLNRAAKWNLVS